MQFSQYPKLKNAFANGNIEIVLKEVKQGSVNIYLKLTHFDNSRFQYRKHAIANTMHPYVAATLVQLASPYMIEDAKADAIIRICFFVLMELFSRHFFAGDLLLKLGHEEGREDTNDAENSDLTTDSEETGEDGLLCRSERGDHLW